jgi:hypothetical protein
MGPKTKPAKVEQRMQRKRRRLKRRRGREKLKREHIWDPFIVELAPICHPDRPSHAITH